MKKFIVPKLIPLIPLIPLISLFLLSASPAVHAGGDAIKAIHAATQPNKLMTFADKKKIVRNVYYKTNSNLNRYKLTEFNNNYQSTEGGVVKIYTHANQIKKIEEIYYGETGKVSYEYYYDNNQLYFVLQTNTYYNAPFTNVGENDNTRSFNTNKPTVEENRYYFYDGEMIQWLDNNRNNEPAFTNRFKQKQNDLIKRSLFNER